MKQLCFYLTIVLLLGSGGLLSAQESVNASGGTAAGSGSASYSVGQVFVSTIGTTVTVAPGVQQPIEISVITGIENPEIMLEIKTYPNPANDFVILKTGAKDTQGMNFSLFDLSGNLLHTDPVMGDETNIGLSGLKPGTYLLRITQENMEIKTFKIIKNQ